MPEMPALQAARKPGPARFQNPQSLALGAALVLLWQIAAMTGLVPAYMLPGPVRVVQAFIADFPLLMRHLGRTLIEALWGLFLSVAVSLALAVLLDANRFLKRSVTPLLLLTQTMPTIAIAPLLILWMGYGMAPKIALIFLTCFFPLAIGLLDGFDQADGDAIRLLRSMGATRRQIYRYIKIPQSMGAFFSGLKISSSYAIVGAVISEWLGGDAGLGVYMIRVRRSYSFDKMFAVILLTAVLSLLLMKLVTELEKTAMPYRKE
jgi:ABC-type nitrate/sulfonate/bicarbonate transport system permease component